MNSNRTTRELQRIIESVAASDGAGVKLRRSLGQSPHTRLDPFLMLDEFSSFDADDSRTGPWGAGSAGWRSSTRSIR